MAAVRKLDPRVWHFDLMQSESERDDLMRLSRELGVSRSDVIRLALREYARRMEKGE